MPAMAVAFDVEEPLERVRFRVLVAHGGHGRLESFVGEELLGEIARQMVDVDSLSKGLAGFGENLSRGSEELKTALAALESGLGRFRT